MYSRKDGISIPKNYNGIRFRNPPEPMPMKEHRPIYRQEVKTAHSPLYNREKAEADTPAFTDHNILPEDVYSENDIITNDYYESEADLNIENKENELCEIEEPDLQEKAVEVSKNDSSLLNSIKLPVSGILNSINREDALLLGLILLLSSEQNSDNSLILTFLALLLLKK